ncbi:hypothetical protein PanWU01x14_189610 [Parasponia andersonii]|uniref:Uncharacterized protein n=1 Tax=Parasponia andersonii TaxID=3476 RepID=A0A2P5C2J4_PARAD|nr:hypothetical protein PanWU01x14_189610 [Parasponia andersonii]
MWSEGFMIAVRSHAEHAHQLWLHDDDDHNHRDSFWYIRTIPRFATQPSRLPVYSRKPFD